MGAVSVDSVRAFAGSFVFAIVCVAAVAVVVVGICGSAATWASLSEGAITMAADGGNTGICDVFKFITIDLAALDSLAPRKDGVLT